MKIAVLGAGMVGRAIALDLAKEYELTAMDASSSSLALLKSKNDRIHTIPADLSRENFNDLLNNFDLVVNAVPGFMGFNTLKNVILAGKNIVDISFFPENALELNDLAIKKDITAIVDCGVAPGMSNLILGYHNARMQVDSFDCMVGGLPKKRVKPFEYKAPFSPIDVIEEYTRPARYVENGCIVTKPALSDSELLDFEHIGTLESFNTDGLRSILFTMGHIPNMKEKTLRYPGHIDLMKALITGGFLSEDKISIQGHQLSPLEFSSAILFKQWKLGAGEEEFTIMKINISGKENGLSKSYTYNLYDEYDQISDTSSMARTTGYTCAAAVNLIARNLFSKKGVFPPELIGSDENCFSFIMNYLEERKVIYKVSAE